VTKRHPDNERAKRRYLQYFKDVKGRDEASIDAGEIRRIQQISRFQERAGEGVQDATSRNHERPNRPPPISCDNQIHACRPEGILRMAWPRTWIPIAAQALFANVSAAVRACQ
jgi:hypothetical protein